MAGFTFQGVCCFLGQPDKIQDLLPRTPANLLPPSDLVTTTCFRQGKQAQIFPMAWQPRVGPCLFLPPLHHARTWLRCYKGFSDVPCWPCCQRGARDRSRRQEQRCATRLVPALVLVCHDRHLLPSHHVTASPRSSAVPGCPRWPGAIRDPGLPSALASAGGGPRSFGSSGMWLSQLWLPVHREEDATGCSQARGVTSPLAQTACEVSSGEHGHPGGLLDVP